MGESSHAEGNSTTASNESSHAEGNSTIASGYYSHAEGYITKASASNSHAEGMSTTASGASSHAEGYKTLAQNNYEHASGVLNISTKASATFGDSDNTLFSVGNGSGSTVTHNAFEIKQNGDIYIANTNAEGEYYEKPMVRLQDYLSNQSGGIPDVIDCGTF